MSPERILSPADSLSFSFPLPVTLSTSSLPLLSAIRSSFCVHGLEGAVLCFPLAGAPPPTSFKLPPSTPSPILTGPLRPQIRLNCENSREISPSIHPSPFNRPLLYPLIHLSGGCPLKGTSGHVDARSRPHPNLPPWFFFPLSVCLSLCLFICLSLCLPAHLQGGPLSNRA